MRVVVFMLPLLLTACALSSDFAFRSTSVTLPQDPMTLPQGPGMDKVATHCLACHSSDMILTQPRLTRKEWEIEVAKMAKVYKAPIDADAVPYIIDYLLTTSERIKPRVKTVP